MRPNEQPGDLKAREGAHATLRLLPIPQAVVAEGTLLTGAGGVLQGVDSPGRAPQVSRHQAHPEPPVGHMYVGHMYCFS